MSWMTVRRNGLALLAGAAVAVSGACGADGGGGAPVGSASGAVTSAGPSAQPGAGSAGCADSPPAPDNAAAIEAAWNAVPAGLRTTLAAQGLKPDGAHGGMAPAAVVSGLVGIHVTNLLAAAGIDDAQRHSARITADVYTALVNRDAAAAAGTKPPGLMTIVRERQDHFAKGMGGYGVNVEFLPEAVVADLNTLFGPVPDGVKQGPSAGSGKPYYRPTMTGSDMLTFWPVGFAGGGC
ncbi:hypothetical protein GCM10009661_00160 [Catellatospora chokoriensis]